MENKDIQDTSDTEETIENNSDTEETIKNNSDTIEVSNVKIDNIPIVDVSNKKIISFEPNNGTGFMDTINTDLGDYTLPSNKFNPPEDKKFAGWSTKLNVSSDEYLQPGSIVRFDIPGKITFFANWVELDSLLNEPAIPINKKRVRFNNGGGSGYMEYVDADIGNYTLPVSTFVPPKNMTFAGWSDEPNGRGFIKKANDTITFKQSGEFTLFATWKNLYSSYNDIPPTELNVIFNNITIKNDDINYLTVGDKININITSESDANVTTFFSNNEIMHFDKLTNSILVNKPGQCTFKVTASKENKSETTKSFNFISRETTSLSLSNKNITIRKNSYSNDFLIGTEANIFSVIVDDKDIAQWDNDLKKFKGLNVGVTKAIISSIAEGKSAANAELIINVIKESINTPILLNKELNVLEEDSINLQFKTLPIGETLSARLLHESDGKLTINDDTIQFTSSETNTDKTVELYVKAVKDTGSEQLVSPEVRLLITVISRPLTDITISGEVNVKVGDEYTYNIDTDANSYELLTSDSTVAVINNNKVIPLKQGKFELIAKATSKGKKENTARLLISSKLKMKPSTPILTTNINNILLTTGEEEAIEFSIDEDTTLIARDNTYKSKIIIKDNILYISPVSDFNNDFIELTINSISKEDVISDDLKIKLEVKKSIKEPINIVTNNTPIILKTKGSYELNLSTELDDVEFKLNSYPENIIITNAETKTLLGLNVGDTILSITAKKDGYKTNILNIPVSVISEEDFIAESNSDDNDDDIMDGEISLIDENKIKILLNKKGIENKLKITRISEYGLEPYKTICSKLINYNNSMIDDGSVEIDPDAGATKNYELYITIKNILKNKNREEFYLQFSIINLFFKEYSEMSMNEFLLNRFDDKWRWGNKSLKTYQNLITIICSLCDITTRSIMLKTLDFGVAFDPTKTDINSESVQNLTGFYKS